MSEFDTFLVFVALIWGGVWAAFLQWHSLGQFLAEKRTWITVVIGIGVDLLILLPLLSAPAWWRVVAVIVASSVCIIARSLYNEYHDNEERLRNKENEARNP